MNYEEIRYEGYGIGGAAVMVDCLTDNRTRTVADVRHAFTKYGGNLGTDGSVAFLFKHCGQFVFAPGTSEDKLMEAALEAGAEDVVTNDDGSIEVITAPQRFRGGARRRSRKPGFKPELAEVTMKPTTENALTGDDAAKMQSCSTRWNRSTTCRRSTRPRCWMAERLRRTIARIRVFG